MEIKRYEFDSVIKKRENLNAGLIDFQFDIRKTSAHDHIYPEIMDHL